MQLSDLDLAHMENLIRLIKRQKYNDLDWTELLTFGACLNWLDKFHDRVKESVKDVNAPIKIDAPSTPPVVKKPSKKRKKRKK